MKGAIYYVATAKVIFSHVKITCYFNMWRYQVSARKLTWYFIGVYIIRLHYYRLCSILNSLMTGSRLIDYTGFSPVTKYWYLFRKIFSCFIFHIHDIIWNNLDIVCYRESKHFLMCDVWRQILRCKTSTSLGALITIDKRLSQWIIIFFRLNYLWKGRCGIDHKLAASLQNVYCSYLSFLCATFYAFTFCGNRILLQNVILLDNRFVGKRLSYIY